MENQRLLTAPSSTGYSRRLLASFTFTFSLCWSPHDYHSPACFFRSQMLMFSSAHGFGAEKQAEPAEQRPTPHPLATSDNLESLINVCHIPSCFFGQKKARFYIFSPALSDFCGVLAELVGIGVAALRPQISHRLRGASRPLRATIAGIRATVAGIRAAVAASLPRLRPPSSQRHAECSNSLPAGLCTASLPPDCQGDSWVHLRARGQPTEPEESGDLSARHETVNDRTSIQSNEIVRSTVWKVDWLLDWLVGCFFWTSLDWSLDWLIDWLLCTVMYRSIDWLIDWCLAWVLCVSIDWLIDCYA